MPVDIAVLCLLLFWRFCFRNHVALDAKIVAASTSHELANHLFRRQDLRDSRGSQRANTPRLRLIGIYPRVFSADRTHPRIGIDGGEEVGSLRGHGNTAQVLKKCTYVLI